MEQDRIGDFLKKIVDDPQIISGIHNYCDRWCERCTHTAHCSVYKMEQAMGSRDEGQPAQDQNSDEFNKKFWEEIETIFKVASSMLHEMMEEMNIDPNDLPDEPFSRPDMSEHKAVALSREYTMKVSDWLKAHREEIKEKHELYSNIEVKKAVDVADAFEIIQYYFMLISTKTYRCSLPIRDDYMDDALGSAKIAIIVIDRSTASWVKLMECFPQWEDDILGFLKQLATVKKLILKHLPNVMDFKRPGFDA